MGRSKGKDHDKARNVSYEGCYGPKMEATEIKKFLTRFVEGNKKLEQAGYPKQVSVIWGHAGIGKCLAGDTPITINNEIVSLETLFDGRKLIPDTRYDVSGLKIHTSSGEKDVSHLYYSGVKPSIGLRTSNGRELIGSLIHPVKVLKEHGLEFVKMSDLTIGDLVCVDDNRELKSKIENKVIDSIYEAIESLWVGDEIPLYDVCVPDGHEFVANGIVVHNTDVAKSFREEGYEVVHLPLAQIEEMGDILGFPGMFIKIQEGTPSLGKKNKPNTKWVLKDVLQNFITQGWEVVADAAPKTSYAPPDWVPTSNKSLLLIDDFNRASTRILKGIMQLIQDYGTVSWNLPEGCNIILTGNPEGQDYIVSSIDDAFLTRCKHITMKHDAFAWSLWAQKNKIDPRGINWVLGNPEMMIGNRTNPRTLTQFFYSLPDYPDMTITKSKKDSDLVKQLQYEGESLLDSETVASFIVYMTRGMDRIVEPLQLLEDYPKHKKRIVDWLSAKEKRIDIINIMSERLIGFIIQDDYKSTKKHVKNFQDFMLMKELPDDIRYHVCRRIGQYGNEFPKLYDFLVDSNELGEMLARTMR